MNRERIPPRIVHAKAGGAFGYFEATKDMSHITKACLFSKVGKRTPVAARFSLVGAERGGNDLSRDIRGFALKFYTEDGNYDLVGLNQPLFAFKDPRLFASLVHALKGNPATNINDVSALWDFLTLRPESFNMFLRVFTDAGIPNGYRHMPGYGIHTFQVENSVGDVNFIRYHLIPDAGLKNFTAHEAREVGADDLDYNTRDLYNSIENGIFPTWTVYLQIITMEQMQEAGPSRICDVTRILPISKYPLTKVGILVLNRNPLNYFAEIEQLGFNPSNLIPGITGAPDYIYQARRLAYRDALNYRLGVNFNKIKVNCPLNHTFTYDRDGMPYVGDNEKDTPNYYPNSFNGPIPYKDKNITPLISITDTEPNNFDQMTDYYTNELTSEQRNRLIENLRPTMRSLPEFIQERVLEIFTTIHPDLGERTLQGLLITEE